MTINNMTFWKQKLEHMLIRWIDVHELNRLYLGFEQFSIRDPQTLRLIKGPLGSDAEVKVTFALEKVFSRRKYFAYHELAKDESARAKSWIKDIADTIDLSKGEEANNFVLKEFIRIEIPDDPNVIHFSDIPGYNGLAPKLTRHSQVEAMDIYRFPKEYEEFKRTICKERAK